MPPVPRRGELRISVPIGYVWHREIGLGFDPDLRIQEVVRLTFARFRQLGCARQVQLGYPAPWQQFSPKRLIGWPLALRSINLGEVHLGIEAVELGALQHGVIIRDRGARAASLGTQEQDVLAARRALGNVVVDGQPTVAGIGSGERRAVKSVRVLPWGFRYAKSALARSRAVSA